MSNSDNLSKEVIKKVRAAGGDVEHLDLSHRYIAYLASVLEANALLDELVTS